jgi:hypothetical protein
MLFQTLNDYLSKQSQGNDLLLQGAIAVMDGFVAQGMNVFHPFDPTAPPVVHSNSSLFFRIESLLLAPLQKARYTLVFHV